MRNCRNIIQKITRDRLSFILLYFGMGLILFSLVKSLGIKAQLDDLTDYENRYKYKYDGTLSIDKCDIDDNTNWEEVRKLSEDIYELCLSTLREIDTEETAFVKTFQCDGMIALSELYYVISEKRDEKYLKKYKYCNDKTDAYITRDLLEFTYVDDGKRYIDIEGKTFRIGGEYTAADIGGRGRVVVLREGLPEDYKQYYDKSFLESGTLDIWKVEIKSNRPLEDELSDWKILIEGNIPSEEYEIFDELYNEAVLGFHDYDYYKKLSEEGMGTELSFAVINLAVILIVWIKRRKKDTAIRIIHGQKAEEIAINYLKEIALCSVMTIPFVALLNAAYSLIWGNTDLEAFSPEYVIYLAVGLVITFLLIFVNLILGVRMVNVTKIIREE